MSIILLNDIVFTYTEEGHIINKEICLFFLALNLINIICCSLYLYIYHKIPHYQNNSNSLTLILIRVNLISGFSYFFFYSDLYFRNPRTLTVLMKISTMINPLVIFTFYFWSACLTHNIYVTFYNYSKNLDKRIKFYKYQLIVYLFIFYVCTMFSIKFKEKDLKSKYFSFIDNYRVNYVILFYLIGLFIITYIIIRLYYIIITKSQSFSLTAPDERTLIIKKLFQSLIFRHILFILYFLFIFVPVNLMMNIKYMFRIVNFEHFYLNFITMTLISFYGTFIFLVKLTDPIMRDFLLSIILFNKKYIKEYEPLMKKEKLNVSNDDLNESLNDEKDILINVYRDLDKSFMTFCEKNRIDYETVEHKNKYTSFNLGNKYGLHFMQGDKKELSKFSKNNLKNLSMKEITNKIKEEEKSELKNNLSEKELEFKPSSVCLINSFYEDEEDGKKQDKNNNIVNNNNQNIYNANDENINNNINKVDTLNDSIHEDMERNNIYEGAYSRQISGNTNSNMINKRNTVNIIGKQLKFRASNQISKKDSKNEEFSENTSAKTNNIPLIFNRKTIEKKATCNFQLSERRKKRFVSHITKNSTDFIYESKNQRFVSPKRAKIYSKNFKNFYEEEISGYALLNYHLEVNDNVQRLIAISICINNDRKYDNQEMYQPFYYSPLPWKNTNFYKEQTPYLKYNESNFPNWLNIKGDSRFNGMEFKVLSFSPFVFHHLRLLDKVSINDILKSLDIKKNLEIINDAKVTGGRGNNTIFRTWDKKLIIKTIDDNEKDIFINKMFEEYHQRMRDTKSILSHIYGIYKIELGNKGVSNVMVQRNMNDLFLDSNILTFDLKGSTVDRQSIKQEDIAMKKQNLFNKYKNIILKDIDLKITGIKIELNPYDGKNILLSICNDSMFLQKYDVTDYSLLIFVNKFNKKNLEKHFGNTRIMPEVNDKYIFNFSIIDYLGTFNLGKKGEKLMKDFVGVFKASKDKNFSVQNPQNYGNRFRKFAKRIINFEKEDNDNDNFSS